MVMSDVSCVVIQCDDGDTRPRTPDCAGPAFIRDGSTPQGSHQGRRDEEVHEEDQSLPCDI